MGSVCVCVFSQICPTKTFTLLLSAALQLFAKIKKNKDLKIYDVAVCR